MNTNDSSSLIDESEIRAALSSLRIDRDAFGLGVRERVEQADVRPASTDDANIEDSGGPLRIAASVLPVNLFGANATASSTSLPAVGFFQKAIAYLSLPAISFLMIAVTFRSWSRIRKAQQSPSHPEADLARMEESLRGWWRRYKWVAITVFVLALAAPLTGWTTPLLLLFMVSAIGTASIVTTLGKAGLVDRDVVGGICMQLLGELASVSFMFATVGSSMQLLDPYLVSATFQAGQAFLLLFVSPGPYGVNEKHKESRQKAFRFLATCIVVLLPLILLTFIVPTPQSVIFKAMIPFIRFALIGFALAILAALILGKLMVWYSIRWPGNQIVARGLFLVLIGGIAAFMGQSLWRPIGTSTLVQHAETFEPRTVGYWSNWQVTARWLRDQGIDYDQSAVQARWLDAWQDGSKNSRFVNQVVSTGLSLPPKLIETKQFKARTRLLLSNGSAGTPISKMDRYEWVIAALAEEGTLTNEQLDHLAGRLLATWRSLNDDSVRIEEAATITNLLTLIDRDLAESERKADVGRWLGEYQVKKGGLFTHKGGFRRYSTLNHSNEMSTEHAVRLMEHYGTHDSVDVLALRAFLRPAFGDRMFTMESGCVRAATRQRLDQIPGIPQPSLWDYFRLNQSQWFAMLMVGLCFYATLGSPKILKEAPK